MIGYYGPDPLYRSPWARQEDEPQRRLALLPLSGRGQWDGGGMLSGIGMPTLQSAALNGAYPMGGPGQSNGAPRGLADWMQEMGGGQGYGGNPLSGDFRSGLGRIGVAQGLMGSYNPLGMASFALPSNMGIIGKLGDRLSATELANLFRDEATYRAVDQAMANQAGYGPVARGWGEGIDAISNAISSRGADLPAGWLD